MFEMNHQKYFSYVKFKCFRYDSAFVSVYVYVLMELVQILTHELNL